MDDKERTGRGSKRGQTCVEKAHDPSVRLYNKQSRCSHVVFSHLMGNVYGTGNMMARQRILKKRVQRHSRG